MPGCGPAVKPARGSYGQWRKQRASVGAFASLFYVEVDACISAQWIFTRQSLWYVERPPHSRRYKMFLLRQQLSQNPLPPPVQSSCAARSDDPAQPSYRLSRQTTISFFPHYAGFASQHEAHKDDLAFEPHQQHSQLRAVHSLCSWPRELRQQQSRRHCTVQDAQGKSPSVHGKPICLTDHRFVAKSSTSPSAELPRTSHTCGSSVSPQRREGPWELPRSGPEQEQRVLPPSPLRAQSRVRRNISVLSISLGRVPLLMRPRPPSTRRRRAAPIAATIAPRPPPMTISVTERVVPLSVMASTRTLSHRLSCRLSHRLSRKLSRSTTRYLAPPILLLARALQRCRRTTGATSSFLRTRTGTLTSPLTLSTARGNSKQTSQSANLIPQCLRGIMFIISRTSLMDGNRTSSLLCSSSARVTRAPLHRGILSTPSAFPPIMEFHPARTAFSAILVL